MNQDQVETVELKAGTLLHYHGMPLELREAVTVNMRHANKQIADEFEHGDRMCHSTIDGRPGPATACG